MRRNRTGRLRKTAKDLVDEVAWNGYLRNGQVSRQDDERRLRRRRVCTRYTKAARKGDPPGKALYRYKILAEVVSRSFRNKTEQLDYVLNKALSLTESKIGYIYLYDEESRLLTLNSWSEDVTREYGITEKHRRCALEETGVWGEVVRQRKPIFINDFQAPDPRKKGYPEGHVELRRFMSVPVFHGRKIVAVGRGSCQQAV
jgi:hypothetical protein